jgi:sugar phosphate isomerase/epimerase
MKRLAIQSYCFREFKDNAKVASMVKELGLSGIEVCAVHADFQKPAGFDSVISTYASAGVPVVSIGVNNIGTDEAAARNIFSFAKKAGCAAMSVNFKLEGIEKSLALCDKLSEEFGIKAGIHNHGGRHWLGNREALDWVFARSSKRIGLSLDTAWAMDARENPVDMIRAYADRLHLMHLKDFLYKPDRTPEDVPVGSGNLKLAEAVKALEEIKFSGQLIIEYEGNPADPMPALSACVKTVKAALKM